MLQVSKALRILRKENQKMRKVRIAFLIIAMMSIIAVFVTGSSYAATKDPVVSNGVTTWDCIWLGNYSQAADGKCEKIKWRVLSVSNNKALLISDIILDASKYHNGSTVTYENSAIYGYLESIKGKMFKADEQKALSDLTLPSENIMTNSKYGFISGKGATDMRRAKSSAYVSSGLGYTDLYYWLSDTNSFRASIVKEKGEITDNFDNGNKAGIRPVVTLDLSKQVWSDAGTVDSNGKETAPSAAAKKANPLKVKVKSKISNVKYSKLKKRNQTISAKKVFTVSKAQGKVSYKKAGGNAKIKINSRGKIIIKKGLKKGKYKIKVKIKAAGNTEYKPASKTVTITIRVR